MPTAFQFIKDGASIKKRLMEEDLFQALDELTVERCESFTHKKGMLQYSEINKKNCVYAYGILFQKNS